MNTTDLLQRETAATLDRQRAEDESYNARTGIVLAVGVGLLVANYSKTPPSSEPAVSAFFASSVVAAIGSIVLLWLLHPRGLKYAPDIRDFARDLDFWPPIDATPYLYSLSLAQLDAIARNNTRLRRKVFALTFAATLIVAGVALFLAQQFAAN